MDRLYYSITEVAKQLNVNPSLLRFWEKEFPQIKLRKNGKGTRFYTHEDIQLIKEIYYLVKEQKMTLDGARKRLKSDKPAVEKNQQVVERLKKIKQELLSIRKQFVAANKKTEE
jgi:DNA-binding transcriptional MerR regulator